MARRRLSSLGAGLALALSVVLSGSTVATGGDDPGKRDLRWDIVSFGAGDVIVAGGSAVAIGDDGTPVSGDIFTVTGSGQVQSHKKFDKEIKNDKDVYASGGGTFKHTNSDGTVIKGKGTYYVTGFVSWNPGGGSIVGLGLTDGVGPIEDATSGVLALAINVVREGGGGHDGVLVIHCTLPGGNPSIEGGVSFSSGPISFSPEEEGGATLFHILN